MRKTAEYTISVYRFDSVDEIVPFFRNGGVVMTKIEGLTWILHESVLRPGKLGAAPVNWISSKSCIDGILEKTPENVINLDTTIGVLYPTAVKEDSGYELEGLLDYKELKDEQDN